MKIVYYITLYLLGSCLALNFYFLFNLTLYKSLYGLLLQVFTIICVLVFLILTLFRKRFLKKKIHEEYNKVFSKN